MYLFKIYLIIISGNIYIWDIGKEAVETASLQAGLCCSVSVSHRAGGDQRPWATCSILCKILKPKRSQVSNCETWAFGTKWQPVVTLLRGSLVICVYTVIDSLVCLTQFEGRNDYESISLYFFVTLYFFVADKVWKYLNLCRLLSGLTFKKEKKQSDWLYILLAVYLWSTTSLLM